MKKEKTYMCFEKNMNFFCFCHLQGNLGRKNE